MIAVFLESMVTCAIPSPEGSGYYRASAGRVCFTAQPIPTSLQRAIPSARGSVTPLSLRLQWPST